MRRSIVDLYNDENRVQLAPRAMQSLDDIASACVGGPLSRVQRAFIFCPDLIAWFTGPYGSGKTSALVASMMMPCLLYPDSNCFLARAVFWTLEETTLKEVNDCIDRLGSSVVLDKQSGPPYKIWIKPAIDVEGYEKPPPSKIIVHSLDDMGKLGSTKFTGVWMDECDEIEQDIFTAIPGRVRYKRKVEPPGRPMGPFFVRGSSNPPSRSHFLHRKFCKEPDCDPEPMGTKFASTRQDNEHNLPANYYSTRCAGMSPAQKLRYMEGLCGPDPTGDGVFSDDFNNSVHVTDIKWRQNEQLICSLDFGRRAPGFVAATRRDGQVLRLLAKVGNNIGLRKWMELILQEIAIKFPNPSEVVWFCDPHGTAKRDVAEKSPVDILRSEFGVNPRYRDVNVATGIELMTKALHTSVPFQGGQRPRNQYDRVGCNILIEGYMSGYQYPKGTKNLPKREKPLADGFYEHPMDCDRYIEVNLAMGSTAQKGDHRKVLRRVRNPETGY